MPVSSEFEAKLRTFHRQVFHAGLDALRQEGILRGDEDLLDLLESSRSTLKRFIKGCHYGFDLAQRGIGSAVIDLENQTRALTKTLKEYRRARDKKAELQAITEITSRRREQLVLRRLADGILHHLVVKERWILRRTQLSDDISAIDPGVLRETLETAAEMNRGDRECFHAVADLTTAVQIGDLIKISFSSRDPTKWEIVELKSGKVNAVLGELIEQLGDAAAKKAESDYDTGTAKQVKRMLRQRVRQEQITSFRETDTGVDPKLEVPVKYSAEPVEVDDYGEAIRKVCSDAKKADIGVASIDGCLRLIAVSDGFYRKQGPRGIAHLFFHGQKGDVECKLQIEEQRDAELEAIRNIWPFFDMCNMNLLSMWPPPVFMWPMPDEMIFDLVCERIRLFAQLDYDRFFDLAKRHGIEMSWTKDAKSTRTGFQPPEIPGSPHARGVRARIIGKEKSPEQILLNGMFARIFLELMPPRQVVEIVADDFEQGLFV